MRLAVFSDIHGNLTAFEAMLTDLEAQGDFDQIWCLGDLAGLGGQPHECLQKLRDLREHYGKDTFKIIGGNADRYLVTGERFPMPSVKEEDQFEGWRDFVISMSTAFNWNLEQLTWEDYEMLSKIRGRELRHKVKGYGHVIGFHAIPGNDESMALRPDTDDEEANDALLDRAGKLAICGHTHYQSQRELKSWLLLNPGSVGLSWATPGQAQWGIFEISDSGVTIDLREVPYDVDATLAQWEAAGYPKMDWARSLLTETR